MVTPLVAGHAGNIRGNTPAPRNENGSTVAAHYSSQTQEGQVCVNEPPPLSLPLSLQTKLKPLIILALLLLPRGSLSLLPPASSLRSLANRPTSFHLMSTETPTDREDLKGAAPLPGTSEELTALAAHNAESDEAGAAGVPETETKVRSDIKRDCRLSRDDLFGAVCSVCSPHLLAPTFV